MTKVLTITFNDIRLYLQTPANVLQITVIPLAFVFIMGLALGGGGGGTSLVRLDVVDEDGTAASGALIEALAEANPNVMICPAANDADNNCQLDPADTESLTGEQALQRLTDSVSSASLTIPAGYEEALATGSEVTLTFQSQADVSAPQVALQTVQRVLTRVGGATVAARLSTDVAEEQGVLAADDRPAYYAARYAEAEAAWGPPAPITLTVEATQQDESDNSGSSGEGFGQSAPGMASMFVMMNVLGLGAVLLEERQDGTLPRLLVMPMTRAQILGGKMLRGFLLGLFQFTLMLVFGSLLGVDFGGNVLAIALIVVSYVLAVTAMAMALATLVRTPDQAFGIGLLASMVLAPLGGAWWPLEIVPDFMRTIGHISPIAWCMDAFNALLYQNGGLSDVLPSVLVLLGVAVVFFVVGIGRFRYE